MKRAVTVVAALIFAALFTPAHGMRGTAASAATPTPAALQYDEINRMALAPATAPPPGSFPADYQAVLAAGNNGGGDDIAGMPEAAKKMMQRVKAGALSRYAYYKGWIRTDDPLAQTAVIEKCAEHQYINLNLANKTYTIATVQPPCPSSMPSMGGNMMGGGQPPEQPGSVDMTMTGTSKSLGPLAIDGIATVGSDNNVSMTMANATGSCQNGSFSMSMTKYVSQIRVPRAFCPLPRTMSAGGMAQRNAGCMPRMHFSGTGNPMNDNDRLVMYSLMNVNAERGGTAMVVERGNVKWFSGAQADALFSIPPDFTKQ